jgi:O-antigen ligase
MMNRSRLSAECPVAESAPESQLAVAARPGPAARPGFGGPLLLLSAGIVLGLAATPGPVPDALTWAGYGAALLTYAAGRALARRGWAGAGAALVVLVALSLGVLAFGPSPLPDRKITAFNAWAFSLGAHLPPLFVPPPHPNAAAGVLAVALALSGATVLAGRGARRAAGALCLLLAGLLLLTASRAGWLAAATALLVLPAGRTPRSTLTGMLLGGLVLAGLMSAGGPALPAESKILSTYSLGVRLEQWRHTLALLESRPLTGLGLGRYPAAYAEAVRGTGLRPYETPANLALQLWADAGLPGVLAGGWAAWRAVRLVRAPDAPGAGAPRWLVLGLGAALAALAVDGLFESVTIIAWKAGASYGYLTSPLPFLLLGLLAGLRADGGKTGTVRGSPGRRATAAESTRRRPRETPCP